MEQALHASFIQVALTRLPRDDRIVGIAAGGSWITRSIDTFSDLDLVIAVEPDCIDVVMADRTRIAESLGPLLVAFTGEHVNEPRLLICLYGPPLLHVDLKFVALPDLAQRVEDPAVLWERDGRMSEAMHGQAAQFPLPDLQWVEDRFWVWIHYGATKLGRGELFEVIGFLAFLRDQVLGPLILLRHGHLPRGVRKIEYDARTDVAALEQTLAHYDRAACGKALVNAANLYRQLRAYHAPMRLLRHTQAEQATLAFLDQVIATQETL